MFYMNLEYYIKQLNKNMPNMNDKKQEKLIAELNDYNNFENHKTKTKTKLHSILKKYFN